MKRLEELVYRLGTDAILLTDEANMRYFTGFCGEGLILFVKDKYFVITDARYTQSSLEETEGKNCEIITITAGGDVFLELNKLVEKLGVKSIAFEAEYLFYAQYTKLQESVKIEKWVPVVEEVDRLRMIKTEEELELIRRAEHIGDMAFLHILSVIREGMTELEVAAQIELALKTNGAEKLSFDTIVASGVNGDKPHAVPTDKKIKKGELITMDFGCKYKGYCSDMTRTIGLGKLNDRQRLVYNTVAEAQIAGWSSIKKGVLGADVDRAARKVIEEAGFGEYFGHGLGHSLGLKIHEDPRFSPVCKTEILPNMLLTVEPGIYIPGELGVRIEDLLVITENGYELISRSDRSLIEIDR